MEAFNILGGETIQGNPVHKNRDYRAMYKNTPVFKPEIIPNGRSAHIGNGVFRSICAGGCGAYADTWGGGYWIPELRYHEHNEHGLDVVGVNIGMLPPN